MTAHKNVMKRYGLTKEELKSGIDTVAKNLGEICNVDVMLAVTDLLCNGDIKEGIDHSKAL